jgi:hypothetical protein
VLAAADGRLTVACGQGALDLLQLQRPGGRRIDAAAFLQARPGWPAACWALARAIEAAAAGRICGARAACAAHEGTLRCST